MSLAVARRSLSRRICGPDEAAAWFSAGPARALRNDDVVGRFFSRQIWSRTAAARSPDSVAGYPRSYGTFGSAGGLFPRGTFRKSAAPGSMWRSSRLLHADAARGGSSFIRQHKHILVVISGIVSAIGGTSFFNAFNEVGMIPAHDEPTAKEAKNVSAMNINLDEVRKEDISNDVEKDMDNDVEKARKKEAAMKARFEAWMKEHSRRYWTRWEKARRYQLFKATAESIDSFNEKMIREGKSPCCGTNCYSDYSDEEWANMGSQTKDLVEFEKLFRSRFFVTREELKYCWEREGKEKRSPGAWQSIKDWLR